MSEQWQRRELGDGAANGAVVADGGSGRLLVVHGTDGFGIVAWRPAEDGFVASDIVDDMTAPVLMPGLAAHGGAAVVVSSDVERLIPRVWRSTDGAAWTEVTTTGLGQPIEVGALTAAPDALYLAGGSRPDSDPATGMPSAAIWRSVDAEHWERLPLPNEAGGGFVSEAVAGADSLIVAVQGAPAAIWRSTDGGSTWRQATVELGSPAGFWAVESIARFGDLVVGVGSIQGDRGPSLLLIVSSDDGLTWSRPSVTEALSSVNGIGRNQVVAAAGAVWLASSQYNGPFENPDVCYRDLLSCQGGARPVLLRSTDGTNWTEIDLAALSTSWIEGLATDPTNALALVGRVAGTSQLAVWTWPYETAPPLRPPAVEPPAGEPPLAQGGDQLTVGRTYRHPLYIHCGLNLLGQFNDRWWVLVEGSTVVDPDLGAGSEPPAHWPIAAETIFGMITLIDDDTINYSIPSGEVIAVYQPATTDPALCA